MAELAVTASLHWKLHWRYVSACQMKASTDNMEYLNDTPLLNSTYNLTHWTFVVTFKNKTFISWMAVLWIIGMSGNFLIIMYFPRKRTFGTVANMFIHTLAVVDIATCFLVIPYSVVYELHLVTVDAVCKFMEFVRYLLVSLSIMTLLSISIERYRAVCSPLHPISMHQALLLQTINAVVSVFTAAFAVTLYAVSKSSRSPQPYCRPKKGHHQTVFSYLFVIIFMGTFVASFTLYTRLYIRFLHQRRKVRPASLSLPAPVPSSRERPRKQPPLNDVYTVQMSENCLKCSSNSRSVYYLKEDCDESKHASNHCNDAGNSSLIIRRQYEENLALDNETAAGSLPGLITNYTSSNCFDNAQGNTGNCSDISPLTNVQFKIEPDEVPSKTVMTISPKVNLGVTIKESNSAMEVSYKSHRSEAAKLKTKIVTENEGSRRLSVEPLSAETLFKHSHKHSTGVLKQRTVKHRAESVALSVPVGETGPSLSGYLRRGNIRLASMLFGVSVIFSLSWLPFWLMKFRVLRYNPMLHYLFLLNNSSNIFVYLAFNASFRKTLLKAVFWRNQH